MVMLATTVVLASMLAMPGRGLAVPSSCGAQWSAMASANIGSLANVLFGTKAFSASDVWTVGYYLPSSGALHSTLAEHYDGTAWTAINPLNLAGTDDFLYGVDGGASSDVWAVGQSEDPNDLNQTLIERRTGGAWSILASPNVGSSDNFLLAVKAISTTDVWAVGHYDDGTGLHQTLIEHWDGVAWSVVASPNQGTSSNYLLGIDGSSASDLWAVGYSYDTGANQLTTLILHYDGSAWSITSSPNVGTGHNILAAVAAPTSTGAFAVGWENGASGSAEPLLLSWDGLSWSVTAQPAGTPPLGHFSAITAVNGSDVWAVGTSSIPATAMFEHYDGTSWSLVKTPNLSGNDVLYSVAAVAGGKAWASGYTTVLGQLKTRVDRLCATVVSDSGFAPAKTTIVQGATLAWAVDPAATTSHSVTDTSGLGLYDTGLRSPGSTYTYTYAAAGVYKYNDTATGHTGSTTVNVAVAPASGTLSTTFTVISATQAPATGLGFDIQIKRPGTTSFKPWLTGVTTPANTFTPDSGAGSYQFRSRLRNLTTGAATGYSPGKGISVTGFSLGGLRLQ
jgi:plastocyanin